MSESVHESKDLGQVNTPLNFHLPVTPGGPDFVTLSSWSFLTSWGQADVYTVHHSESLQNFLSVVSDMCLKTELKIIILASSGASTSLCKHKELFMQSLWYFMGQSLSILRVFFLFKMIF